MNRIISRVRVWAIWRKNKFASVPRPRRRKIRIDGKALRGRRSYLKKIAALVAPAVVLVSLPVPVMALDSFIAPAPVSPERIAVVMACAGGFTLVMLIRRRRG